MFERTGGVQQLVTHLHDGLVKKGHTVKIITPKPSGFEGEVPPDTILLGTASKFTPGLGTTGTWTFDISDKEVQALLDGEKFDVINFHEPWAPILARQILNRSTEAHVATFHANLMDNMAAKSLVNVFLPYGRGIGRKMQVLTAVSPAPAAVLVDKANNHIDSRLVENIKYIPNGVDLKLYHPPKKRLPLNGPDTKTVVYVGRLEDRKGVDLLIKAFAELVKEMPHVYLTIAGEGKQRRQLEDLVETEKIENVNFLGFVSDEQKRHLMGNADLVCSPAMYGESFGIVPLEAMAMGAPVIAGNNIGYKVVVKGIGRIGLVDAKSTSDFANRMSVILSEPPVQNMLRRWGVDEAKQYDYPKIIDQYEAAYIEALKILNDFKKGRKEATKDAGSRRQKLVHRLSLRRQPR
ncbi:MAG: glycosyltransferase family 4 protein [Candidatus Saccharimonadales bacterium]